MKSIVTGLIAATALIAAALPAGATEPNVQIGRLSCDVEGGFGLIIGSQKGMSCTFYGDHGATESYSGKITRVGLDIGKTEATRIEWLVFAAKKTEYTSHALAGKYLGASGEATFVVGLGGNVLVGGFEKSYALQPFSAQAQTGLSLAAGLAELTLN